jgi:Domain of unknown function (DUF4267)
MTESAAAGPDVRGWSLASGVGRIAFGLGMLAAPERALGVAGFREVTPATVAVTRVAGIRDFVLGALTLTALDDPDRLRVATLANTLSDAGDAAAFAVTLRTEERAAGKTGLAAALPAMAVGIWAAWRLS